MVKVADFSVGQEIKASVGPMTRNAIKEYGKVSKDTNAIHMSDVAAVQSKLKGVIQHGMFSYAYVIVYLDDMLGDDGKIRKITSEMRGMVRPGDTLDMTFKITAIEGKTVKLDWEQIAICPINVTKNGEKILSFEAEERGWISEKDIERGLIHEKDITEPFKYLKTVWEEPGFPEGKYTETIEEYTGDGVLKYRARLSLRGTAELELKE